MGSNSKKVSPHTVTNLARSVRLQRSKGNALTTLVEICQALGKDWCLRVYWSGNVWEVELKSSYGILEYASAVQDNLLKAIKEIARKIEEDIENGSIDL